MVGVCISVTLELYSIHCREPPPTDTRFVNSYDIDHATKRQLNTTGLPYLQSHFIPPNPSPRHTSSLTPSSKSTPAPSHASAAQSPLRQSCPDPPPSVERTSLPCKRLPRHTVAKVDSPPPWARSALHRSEAGASPGRLE